MQIFHEDTKNNLVCRIGTWNTAFNPFHWHDNIEICYMFNNPGDFIIEGSTVRASVGDIVVMGEREVHKFCIDKLGSRIYLLQISPRILLSSSATIKPVKTHISSEEISKIPQLREYLETLLDMVRTAYEHGGSGDIPYIQNAAATVYFLLMHHFPGDIRSDSVKERRIFYDIAEFVNNHFTDNISVQTIASAMYISRGKAGAVFAKYSGTTLGEYINSMRINHANKLLTDGKSITEAAYESGFQNIRTFNTAYKKAMGITPGEYMKGN